MRCLAAARTLQDQRAHAVYYQNPGGLSTRPDTRGVVEANMITHRYGPQLLSPNYLMKTDRFEREVLHRPGWMPPAPSRYAASVQALRDLARRHRMGAGAPAAAPEAPPRCRRPRSLRMLSDACLSMECSSSSPAPASPGSGARSCR